MGKGVVIGIIVAILIIIIVLIVSVGNNVNKTSEEKELSVSEVDTREVGEEKSEEKEADETKSHTVVISSSGFSPNVLEIKRGDRVIFINRDSNTHWPASNVHPTHTVYPGSSIQKCGSDAESTIFDSCKELRQGEEYSFVFNEIGRWNYHDHSRASLTGTIIVK